MPGTAQIRLYGQLLREHGSFAIELLRAKKRHNTNAANLSFEIGRNRTKPRATWRWHPPPWSKGQYLSVYFQVGRSQDRVRWARQKLLSGVYSWYRAIGFLANPCTKVRSSWLARSLASCESVPSTYWMAAIIRQVTGSEWRSLNQSLSNNYTDSESLPISMVEDFNTCSIPHLLQSMMCVDQTGATRLRIVARTASWWKIIIVTPRR